jgi:hypothetical protein
MHPPSPESTRIVEDRSTRICSKRPHPRSILGPAWRTKTVRGAYRWRSEISCLQYSLDGRYFASGSSDHSIRLAPVHQMNQGIEAIILLGYRSRITGRRFPDLIRPNPMKSEPHYRENFWERRAGLYYRLKNIVMCRYCILRMEERNDLSLL